MRLGSRSPQRDRKHRVPTSRMVSGTTVLGMRKRPAARHRSAIRQAHFGRAEPDPRAEHPAATKRHGRTHPAPRRKRPAATRRGRGRTDPGTRNRLSGRHPTAIAHLGKADRRPRGKSPAATMRHCRADMEQRGTHLATRHCGRAVRCPRGRLPAATRHSPRAAPSDVHPPATKTPRRAASALRGKPLAVIKPRSGRAGPRTRNRLSGRRRSVIRLAHHGRAAP